MQTKPTPTEGQNSDKLEAESVLRGAACSALNDTLDDLYDSQQNLGKERGKVTLLMMAINGAICDLEYIMDSAVSVPVYAACSTRIEELQKVIADIKQNVNVEARDQ